MAKKPPANVRAARVVQEHPKLTLTTLIAIGTLLTMLGGFTVWVASFFVFKSDFLAFVKAVYVQNLWHDVSHQQMRVERLNDEVDRMHSRAGAAPLNAADKDELSMWQKKLESGQIRMEKLGDDAKEKSKVKPEDFTKPDAFTK